MTADTHTDVDGKVWRRSELKQAPGYFDGSRWVLETPEPETECAHGPWKHEYLGDFFQVVRCAKCEMMAVIPRRLPKEERA